MPEVEGLMIKEAGQERYSFHPGTNVPYPPEADVEVRLAGPATNLSGIAVKSAPAELSLPQIIGDGRIGDTFTRQSAGAASGSPAPEKGSPIWARRPSGQSTWVVIDGASGETYTAGDDLFDEGDDLRSGTPFTNSEGSITLWSLPIKISAAPQITAASPTLTAGQQASITFSIAPDSVTVTQGGTALTATRVGTTNEWRFTPATAQPVSISATKAGYTPYSVVVENVAPAPSVLVIRDRELMVDNEPTADRTLDISAPDRFDATGINIAADQYTDGMKVIAAPIIEQNGGVITASRGGLFSWFAEQEPVFFSHDYYRGTAPQTATLIPDTADAESYTVDPVLDGGNNIYRRDRMINALQASVTVFSNGLAIPAAAGMSNGLTHLGAFDGGVAEVSAITHTTSVNIGPADPGKTVWIYLLGVGTVNPGNAKLRADGVDYVGNRLASQIDSTAGYAIQLWEFACPIGGMVDLTVTRENGPNRPRGFLSISKGLTNVSTHTNALTAVAGTEFNYSNGTTLEGDILLTAVAGASQGLASGMFSNVRPVSELFDGLSGNAQLMVGAGPVAAASTARIYMTSSVGGGLRWITLKLRSA